MGKLAYTGVSDRVFEIVNLTLISILSFLVIYPLYYVLLASFTDPDTLGGQLLIFPKRFFFGGYKMILSYSPLWRSYLNTIRYVAAGVAISLGLTLPCAYALSRKDFLPRRLIMFLFTFTMFFQGGLIPLFLVVNGLKL